MATTAKHQQQQTTVVRSVSVSSSSASSSSLSKTLPTHQRQQSPTSSGDHSYQQTPKIHHIHQAVSPLDKNSRPTSPGFVTPGGVGAAHGHFLLRSTTNSPQNNHHYQTVKPIESDEEVESIAKQISDHAEAIYQTWKARGLAPTEILNCHNFNEAGVQFGKSLTPPNIRTNLESPVAEFLSKTTPDMSNNNLEKLVSSFVNEDKARQNAAKRNSGSASVPTSPQQNLPNANSVTSILTSGTIRDALKKFESSNNSTNGSGTVGGMGYIKPNFLISKGYTIPQKKTNNVMSHSATLNNIAVLNTPTTTSTTTLKSSNTKSNNDDVSQVITQNNLKLKNVPDVLLGTINAKPQQDQIKSQKNTTIINNDVGSTKKQQQLQENNKNSSNSVPVLIGGRISPTKQSTKFDNIDSKISSSISNTNSTSSSNNEISSGNSSSNNSSSNSSSNNSSSSSNNSGSNSILLNSSTTSITSNLSKTKPQTPVKPANLLNHQPVWPHKNRNVLTNASGSSVTPINNINSPIDKASASINKFSNSLSPTTTTAPAAINNSININSSSSSGSSISNSNSNSKLVKQTEETTSGNNIGDISKLLSTTTTLASVAALKKSSDLLDEVTREEERLINALKTGIVLNNNNNNNSNNNILINNKKNASAPEVIQSKSNESFNQNTKLSSVIINSRKSLKSTIKQSSDQQNNSSSSSATAATNEAIVTTTSKICDNDEIKMDTDIKLNSNATAILSTQSGLPKDTLAPTSIKTTIMRPKNNAAVPHPEQKSGTISLLSNYTNSRTNNTTINPVRPFLTRGSVAERVMMFEKCPDVKAPMRNINREPLRPPKIHSVPKPEPQSHTTLQRAVRASHSKNVYIPRFHYPCGKPLPNIAQETIIQRIKSTFDSFPNNQVSKDDFPKILKICGLPFYWRMPFIACTQIMAGNLVDGYRFVDFWKQMSVYCHDIESRFVFVLSRGQRIRPYILPEDLAPLVQDVVDNHPGLAFLKEAAEFHSRYVHTVIARIFYSVNRSWSGRITVAELRRSNLIQVIQLLEEEEDINQIMAFFSYEHFYVIYCKFWELDRDHDLFIDQNDLARHNDHALSTRIIERIFSGCVTRGGKFRIIGPNGPKISYTEFVWFLLSEEDKTNPTSIEYWFRCMDLDGDGIISMYELEYFYEEQQQRMESIGIETLPFEDCLCQMLDMIKPCKTGCITLTDLKRCKMTSIFFDTFFNLEKYLEHEQRDPFASQRDDEMSDWDRYAAQEYELLVAEEGADQQGSFEEDDDDYESNIEVLESQMDDMSNLINEW